ncbi:MAG: hypothetical protein H0U54_00905 [Acidobacteria bacterium]|nr:hypothetical protein [Acidobacteriota bacterium]
MSQKNKRGLQRGLNDIVEKQTAPVTDKSQESSSLIAKFRDQPLLPPPTTSLQPEARPIAPVRDFAKVANSITRDAIPGGLFKGTSKKLYDALYLRTRGAIVPVRQVKARQGDLMQWAGVSHNTLRTHLRSLEAVGLIEIKWELGDNYGAVYEVRLPEEIALLPPPTTSLQPPPSSSQKLGPPSNQKLEVGGGGQVVENSTAFEQPKTLIKTNTERSDDDAALAGLTASLKTLTKEITGKELSPAESDRWRELADVLAAELKIAAARTTVSSVPAFLAEHLRRRLWKLDKKQARAEGRELPDEAVSAPQGSVDASSCPDCSGSGWWYPEGEGKGVAKCKHEKLMMES